MLTSVTDSPSSDEATLEEACGAIWATLAKQKQDTEDISIVYQSLLGLCQHQKDVASTIFNPSLLFNISGAVVSVVGKMQDMTGQITEDEIDLMISMLDIVLEFDFHNIQLLEKMMEIVLVLCHLRKDIIHNFGVVVVVLDCMWSMKQRKISKA